MLVYGEQQLMSKNYLILINVPLKGHLMADYHNVTSGSINNPNP